MANFSTNLIDIPQLQQQDLYAVGARAGEGINKLGNAISSGVMNYKAQDLIKAFNDPKDHKYAGLTGSRRTEALAADLMDISPELAEKYRTQAQQERMNDFGVSIPTDWKRSGGKSALLHSLIQKVQDALSKAGKQQAASQDSVPTPNAPLPEPVSEDLGIPLAWAGNNRAEQFQNNLHDRVSSILGNKNDTLSSIYGVG